jgi:hypothetical protein
MLLTQAEIEKAEAAGMDASEEWEAFIRATVDFMGAMRPYMSPPAVRAELHGTVDTVLSEHSMFHREWDECSACTKAD